MAGSMIYNVVPGAIQTTNATALVANDCFFIVSGTTAAGIKSRNVGLQALWPGGRGAGLNLTSGLTYRVEKWTTAASSGGTGITPRQSDPGFQAAYHTAGYSASTVTSGTGGPWLLLSILSGATGPTAYIAPNPAAVHILEAGAPMSLDVFCVSGTQSLSFELSAQTIE